jgi:hypothetical protein
MEKTTPVTTDSRVRFVDVLSEVQQLLVEFLDRVS